jgi:hypothetical protein
VNCPISPEALKLLPLLHNLTVLDLNAVTNLTEDLVSPIIEQNPHLSEINLRHGKNIPSSLVSKIASFCPHLTSLDVAYCPKIKDERYYDIRPSEEHIKDINIVGEYDQKPIR